MVAIGLLVCDDEGRFTQTQLDAAMQDAAVIQAARSLLREAAQCQ